MAAMTSNGLDERGGTGLSMPVEEVKKYKHKSKELKRRISALERESEDHIVQIARAKQAIQRLRLERAFIFERLEERVPVYADEMGESGSDVSSEIGDTLHARSRRRSESTITDMHEDGGSPSVADTPDLPTAAAAASTSTKLSKKEREKLRDPDMPKRPANPYLRYCEEHRDRVRRENEGVEGFDLTKAMAAAWQGLTPSEKRPYTESYERDKVVFGERYAEYKVNLAKKKSDAESFVAPDTSTAVETVHDMVAPPQVVKQEDTVMRESGVVEQEKQPAAMAVAAAPAPATMGGFTAVNQGRASSLDPSKLPSRG